GPLPVLPARAVLEPQAARPEVVPGHGGAAAEAGVLMEPLEIPLRRMRRRDPVVAEEVARAGLAVRHPLSGRDPIAGSQPADVVELERGRLDVEEELSEPVTAVELLGV